MAHDEGDDPERPGEAHGQRRQHEERRDNAPECDHQEHEGEREGQRRGHLAVAEGGDHLVVRDGRASRHARPDVGELALQARDGAADGRDRLPPLLVVPVFLHQQEQPVAVRREKVAGVGFVESAHREGGGPGRRVRGFAVETGRDLIDHGLQEAQVARPSAAQSDVEEPEDHPIGDLLVESFEKLGQRRMGRVGVDEFLVVEQPVAQRGEVVDGQVEQGPLVEVGGLDPVGDRQ